MAPDFIVQNHGTILHIHAVTAAAEAWVEENVGVESWQGTARHFYADHRPGWGLVEALEDPANNFVVEIR